MKVYGLFKHTATNISLTTDLKQSSRLIKELVDVYANEKRAIGASNKLSALNDNKDTIYIVKPLELK